MYFIHTETLELVKIDDPERYYGKYIILSHTWDEEEVLFGDLQESPYDKVVEDLQNRLATLESSLKGETSNNSRDEADSKKTSFALCRAKKKKGWSKIEACCKEASKYGISLVWIDTCCINKDSSAELSEAINSMFALYRDAKVCLAYLQDVSSGPTRLRRAMMPEISDARWFTRGWTLQELIAPNEVIFFDRDWNFIGTRSSLTMRIAAITGIHEAIFGERRLDRLFEFSVAVRLSWAADREVTRLEDRAYSLMGLFGVNMPIIYGEGERSAFLRLQQEIFNGTGDHSIFAWTADRKFSEGTIVRLKHLPASSKTHKDMEVDGIDNGEIRGHYEGCLAGLFALSLDGFRRLPPIHSAPYGSDSSFPTLSEVAVPSRFSVATHGIHVKFLLQSIKKRPRHIIFVAYLACRFVSDESSGLVGIYLVLKEPGQYLRVVPHQLLLLEYELDPSVLTLEDVYVFNTLVSGIKPRYRQMWKFYRVVEISVTDEEFLEPGFTIGGLHGKAYSHRLYLDKTGAHISLAEYAWVNIYFQHHSTEEAFAIGVTNHNSLGLAGLFQTRDNSEINPAGELTDLIQSRRGENQQCLTTTKIASLQLKSGRHVFVSLSHGNDPNTVGSRHEMKVIIKGGLEPQK